MSSALGLKSLNSSFGQKVLAVLREARAVKHVLQVVSCPYTMATVAGKRTSRDGSLRGYLTIEIQIAMAKIPCPLAKTI